MSRRETLCCVPRPHCSPFALRSFRAALLAFTYYGLAAEKAMQTSSGPGSFRVNLLDCLYTIDKDSCGIVSAPALELKTPGQARQQEMGRSAETTEVARGANCYQLIKRIRMRSIVWIKDDLDPLNLITVMRAKGQVVKETRAVK